MRLHMLAATALALAIAGAPLHARDAATTTQIPPSGVIGVGDAQLTPQFWIGQLDDADRVILDTAAIAAQNARLFELDTSMHDLRKLPATLARDQVSGWITALSKRPQRELFDVAGKPVPASTLDAVVDNLALSAIPAQQSTRYGLVVHRAALRTFPTQLRVFSHKGDTDIDRFQESAMFPGTPVAIVHTSADGKWLFVVSPRYAAWVEKDRIAEGTAKRVFDYVGKTPYRIVTGASVRTVFTREQPGVSELRLDMGTRVPLATGLAADKPVNGQTAYTSYTVDLPVRADDGSLRIVPALLQKNTDTASDYLPLTRANIIRQAFKFLGERYGWGHSYDGRDCSGFVSDTYHSMGVQMPRNTSSQGVSPALEHRLFTDADSHEARMKAAMALQVGDLVYIPGHVMMVIGHIDGKPYVIHDTGGMSYRAPDGSITRIKLNAVSVTPLLPLLFNKQQTYVDRMTSIVRIRH